MNGVSKFLVVFIEDPEFDDTRTEVYGEYDTCDQATLAAKTMQEQYPGQDSVYAVYELCGRTAKGVPAQYIEEKVVSA